jgi:hypothetical protein
MCQFLSCIVAEIHRLDEVSSDCGLCGGWHFILLDSEVVVSDYQVP